MLPLFTSIKPPADAAELSYLRDCLDSWRAAGFGAVAVNGPNEMETLRDFGLRIEFAPLPIDGKPRIGAILSAVRDTGVPYAGIVNSDCRMIRYPNIASLLQPGLSGALVIGWRLDIGGAHGLHPLPLHGGFDAFFFDTAIIPDDDAGFSIGEPWWDLWFPLAARLNGARLETLDVPLLTHRRHLMNWGEREYQRGGKRLLAFLDSRQEQCAEPFPFFIGQPLDILIRSIPRWIHQQAQTTSLLAPEMAEIETMLRLGGRAMIEAAEQPLTRSEETRLRSEPAWSRAEFEAIKNSTCWWLTAPLRAMIKAIRRPQRDTGGVAKA